MDPSSIPWPILALTLAALLLGGVIKGTVGIGMPLVTVSVLSGFVQPRLVLALLVVPVIVTNILQVRSTGHFRQAAVRFWPLIVAFALGTWWGAQIMASIDTALLLGALGVIVILFSLTNLATPYVRLSARHERATGPCVGLFAGLLNGLSTVNGPPLIMYLVSLGMEKEEFVGSYGLIVLAGSIPLALSFAAVGVLGAQELIWSSAAVAPALAGLVLGQRLRAHINSILFRRLLIGALLLLGANLVRRAVVGA